jgi:hypothetical protein
VVLKHNNPQRTFYGNKIREKNHINFIPVFVMFFVALFTGYGTCYLTKQQMYEDFDEMYEIIKEINPQLVVCQKNYKGGYII